MNKTAVAELCKWCIASGVRECVHMPDEFETQLFRDLDAGKLTESKARLYFRLHRG